MIFGHIILINITNYIDTQNKRKTNSKNMLKCPLKLNFLRPLRRLLLIENSKSGRYSQDHHNPEKLLFLPHFIDRQPQAQAHWGLLEFDFLFFSFLNPDLLTPSHFLFLFLQNCFNRWPYPNLKENKEIIYRNIDKLGKDWIIQFSQRIHPQIKLSAPTTPLEAKTCPQYWSKLSVNTK